MISSENFAIFLFLNNFFLTGFGVFSKTESSNVHKAIEDIQDDLESKKMEETMGISGFGKKAKQFDINEMLQLARKSAKPVEKAAVPEQEKSKEPDNSDEEDEFIGPLPTLASSSNSEKRDKKKTGNNDKDSSEDDSEEEEDEEDGTDNIAYRIPCSHEVQMNHGSKAISALAADKSGARLVSGSIDYELCFWDFSGMDKSMKYFRKIQPCENHPIRCVQYSLNGELILLVSGSSQVCLVIFSRKNLHHLSWISVMKFEIILTVNFLTYPGQGY